MLQAHSFLWHYFWIAPNVLMLVLALLMWRRGLHRKHLVFFVYAICAGVEQLLVYAADVTPRITPDIWWKIFWAGLVVEGLLKFAVIGEIISHAFCSYGSLAQLGKLLTRGIGTVLVLAAVLAAAYAPQDGRFGIVSGAHLLQQTIYLTETGLLLFVFLFAAYFRLHLEHGTLGIALGLSVSACVHLTTLALAANGVLENSKRIYLDFLNMAAYHLGVLIWFYFLLVPHKVVTKSTVSLPDHNLELWNRELERLLHP